MTESVEWERLADHEEAPRSAAGVVVPMSDERLAEIRRHYASYSKHPYVGIPACCSAHASADDVPELLAEVTSLREQLQSATVLPERWRELMAERDAARRELAEVRERIGELREEWGVRTYGSDDDTEVMRTREQAEDLATAWRTEIPNSNPTVRVRTQCAPGPWRDVEDGEWKVADGG